MKEGIDMLVAVKWQSSVYIIEAYAEEKEEEMKIYHQLLGKFDQIVDYDQEFEEDMQFFI